MRHQPLTLLITIATAALSVYLYIQVPKGFFPQQDTGRVMGSVQAAQDISFAAMQQEMQQFVSIVMHDPTVQTIVGFAGGNTSTNQGRMFITLKPLAERKLSADQVIGRLRRKLAVVPGATLFMQSAQDLTIGGRQSQAQYPVHAARRRSERTELLGPSSPAETAHAARTARRKYRPAGQGSGGNRDHRSRHRFAAGGFSADIDNALYDAFGQRQVSTMYKQLNQYHVVMEVDPRIFQQHRTRCRISMSRSSNGTQVPLAAFAHFGPSNTPLGRQPPGPISLRSHCRSISRPMFLWDRPPRPSNSAQSAINFPATIHASFQGTAAAFQESLASEPLLILAALVTVYIVLGILYESYIHPITILSTLPSAGVGALLALLLTHSELNVMGLIGIILLIGIVKKNAIMMIDFALEAERAKARVPQTSIYEACMLRFRPIMMTTMAALLGGLPLALGTGTGSELRQPLGITIVGGLILSQALTLFTTPVVYLYLDRFRLMLKREKQSDPSEISPLSPRPSGAD